MADNPPYPDLKKLNAKYAAAVDRLKDARWRVNIFKARIEGECRRNRLRPNNIELKHINSVTEIDAELEPAFKLLLELDSLIAKYPNITKAFRLESYRNNLLGYLKELFKGFLELYQGVIVAISDMGNELAKIRKTITGEYNLQVPYVHALAIRVVERVGGMGNSLAFRYACKNIDETKSEYLELWGSGNRVKNQVLDGLRLDMYGR